MLCYFLFQDLKRQLVLLRNVGKGIKIASAYRKVVFIDTGETLLSEAQNLVKCGELLVLFPQVRIHNSQDLFRVKEV